MRKIYRLVEFGERFLELPGKVAAIEYDPNRNAYLVLVEYGTGEKAYLLAPHDVKVGDEIVCGEDVPVRTGNRTRLLRIPVGTMVHNVELEPLRGGKMVRGAGTGARILTHEGTYTHLVMPSSEVRKVPSKAFASVGIVSNPEHRYQVIGKAGRVRLKGRRPVVRGSAMNPVDHPHGGGEGRTGIGLKHPKTPWGKPALGPKTRRKSWTQKLIISRRKKRKK